MFRERQSSHFGNLRHAPLGSAVGRNGRDRQLGIHRRHIDDRALDARRHHRPARALDRHEHSAQIDRQNGVKIRQIIVKEIARQCDPCVVDQLGDNAMLRLDLIKQSEHRLRL